MVLLAAASAVSHCQYLASPFNDLRVGQGPWQQDFRQTEASGPGLEPESKQRGPFGLGRGAANPACQVIRHRGLCQWQDLFLDQEEREACAERLDIIPQRCRQRVAQPLPGGIGFELHERA